MQHYNKCYRASAKGKSNIKRYYASAKGKLAVKRYRASAKGKSTRKLYRTSAKGKLGATRWRKRYSASVKGKRSITLAKSLWSKTENGKRAAANSQRALHAKIRLKLIALYTAGTNKCVNCAGSVDELHHVHPEDGKAERVLFGSVSVYTARLYQVKKYDSDKHYIAPLCHACHKEVHDKIRKNKEICKQA